MVFHKLKVGKLHNPFSTSKHEYSLSCLLTAHSCCQRLKKNWKRPKRKLSTIDTAVHPCSLVPSCSDKPRSQRISGSPDNPTLLCFVRCCQVQYNTATRDVLTARVAYVTQYTSLSLHQFMAYIYFLRTSILHFYCYLIDSNKSAKWTVCIFTDTLLGTVPLTSFKFTYFK